MSERVSEGLTEAARRDLVERIAERGTRGYETVETTTQPSRDYAAAAQAAVAADPVELPPAAQAALAELTGAPAETANLYAEAQRAIFAAGQAREAEMGNQYYDDTQRQIGAHNFELDEYAGALEEAERFRVEAQRRARSAGRSSSAPAQPTRPSTVQDDLGEGYNAFNEPIWPERAQAPPSLDLDPLVDEEEFLRGYQDAFDTATEVMGNLFLSGRTLGGSTGWVWGMLLNDFGMPEADARRMIETLTDVWGPQWDVADNPTPSYGGSLPSHIRDLEGGSSSPEPPLGYGALPVPEDTSQTNTTVGPSAGGGVWGYPGVGAAPNAI